VLRHDQFMTGFLICTNKESILTQFLKAGYFENGRLFPTDKGAPQGRPSLPILATWINGLEAELGRNFMLKRTGKSTRKAVTSIKSTTPDLRMILW